MKWDNQDIEQLLQQMAERLNPLLAKEPRPIHLVGIYTGGVWLANRLNAYLDQSLTVSTLATRFYRDDLQQRGLKTDHHKTLLPHTIDDSVILLVDDVLMSGRTIRAALNELFDYGRPAKVLLATLFDIGHRELPIRADVCGQKLSLPPQQRVELHGPTPLRAETLRLEDTHS